MIIFYIILYNMYMWVYFRTSEKEFGKNTGWLFLESADTLFAVSSFHGMI